MPKYIITETTIKELEIISLSLEEALHNIEEEMHYGDSKEETIYSIKEI